MAIEKSSTKYINLPKFEKVTLMYYPITKKYFIASSGDLYCAESLKVLYKLNGTTNHPFGTYHASYRKVGLNDP
jgi:hypothetical protein